MLVLAVGAVVAVNAPFGAPRRRQNVAARRPVAGGVVLTGRDGVRLTAEVGVPQTARHQTVTFVVAPSGGRETAVAARPTTGTTGQQIFGGDLHLQLAARSNANAVRHGLGGAKSPKERK